MATPNIIEVLIRSVISGTDKLQTYQRQLDLFGKEASVANDIVARLADTVAQLEKAFGKGAGKEFLKGVVGSLKEGIKQLDQASSSTEELRKQIIDTAQHLSQLSLFDKGAASESLKSIRDAANQYSNLGDAGVESLESISQAAKRHEESLKDVTKDTDLLNSAWVRLGATIVVLNQGLQLLDRIFGPIQRQFSLSIDQAAEMQRVVTQLDATLQTFGKQIPTQELVRFAGELQRTLGIADDATLEVARMLASLTDLDRDGLKQATRGAIALSQSLGVDLRTAALQIGQILNGNISTIRGTGISIDETTALTDRYAAVMKQLNPLVEIATKNTETYDRQQKILSASINDLRRAVGESLIGPLQTLQPVMLNVVQVVTEWTKANPTLVTSLGVATTAVTTFAVAVGALAAVQLAGIGPALAAASTAILAFASGPAGIALLTIAFALNAAAIEKFRTNMADLAAAKDPETAAKRIAQLRAELEHLERFAKGDIGAQNALKQRIKAIEDAAKAAREGVRAGAQAGAGGGDVLAGAPSQGRIMEEALSRADKQITEFVENARANLIKARADVAAQGERMLFDMTGDFEALQRSFSIAEKGIVDSSAKALERQVKQLADSLKLKPEELGDRVAPLRAASDEQKQIQLQQLRQQKERALFQFKEQARAAEQGQLRALETAAQAVLDVEQSRLNILKEQGAPINQQDEQLAKVQDAEAARIALTIQRLESQRATLQSIILIEGQKGVKLKETETVIANITAEIQKQVGAEEALAAKRNLPKQIQDQKNRIDGIRGELAALEEIRQHDADRAIKVDELTATYNKQAEAIRRATEISLIGDEDTRRVLELTTAYDAQVRELENLITKYPEAEAAIRSLIDAMGGQLKVNVQQTTEQLGNLQQSLTDVFASSIDRSFDTLLDRTRSFGDRMTGLMEGIGETIFKTILHHAITIPLQSGLAELFKTINSLSQGGSGGGGFGGFLGIIGSIAGLFTGGAGAGTNALIAGGHADSLLGLGFAEGGVVLAGAGGPQIPHMLTNRLNIPRLAQGAVVKRPTLALIGEGGEDEFIIPRSKMKNMQGGGGQTNVKVEINGDITPRQPNMKPEDVIKVVVDDGMRSDRSGIGGMIKKVITRNK